MIYECHIVEIFVSLVSPHHWSLAVEYLTSFSKVPASNPVYTNVFFHANTLLIHVTVVMMNSVYVLQSPYSLGSYHAHTIQSLSQSLSTIIEFALYNVYCPLSGLVELAALWYRLFQQHSHRVSVPEQMVYMNKIIYLKYLEFLLYIVYRTNCMHNTVYRTNCMDNISVQNKFKHSVAVCKNTSRYYILQI